MVMSQPGSRQDWERYLRHRQKAIKAAKHRLRPDWSEHQWEAGGFADSDILDISMVKDTTPRIPMSSLTKEEWLEKYERTRTPVILTGVTKGWKAPEAWTLANLNATYGHTKFKVGEDEHGDVVRLKMRYFLEYCEDPVQAGSDDSPLYVFDSNFNHPGMQPMLEDYDVPHFFTEDLLKYAGDIRPAYRWVVIGAARSGTWLHLDPLYTSAWNTLLSGTKRWILFPPKTPKELVSPKDNFEHDHEGVTWFKYVYPETQKPSWPFDPPIEIIQRPGETIYVPGGWWHAVLNLDMTVAITQNYANSINFPMVWTHSVVERPYMAKKWLATLREYRPDIAEVADHIQKYGCPDCETEINDNDSSESPPGADYEDHGEPAREEQAAGQQEVAEQERAVQEEENAQTTRSRRMKIPDSHGQLPSTGRLPSLQGGSGRTLTGLDGNPLHQTGTRAIAANDLAEALASKEPFLLSHGALMMSSWILLFPLAVLLARHKWVLGDRKLRWMHVAFHMLRLVQVLGFLTMLAGLVIALVALDAPDSRVGKLHFFVGAVVFAFSSLRALGNPGANADGQSHLLRDKIHSWVWRLLPLAGFANVFIGIVLMNQISDGYYSYGMWVLPICVIAGSMLVLEIVLSNMKSVRGVRDLNSRSASSYPQDSKSNRSHTLAGDLHFRPMRHGITNSMDIN